MYYNADLLEIGNQDGRISLGFIYHITYGIEGNTDKGNVRTLKQALVKAEEWREKHGAKFETKYVLVHFSRKRLNLSASINVNGVTIKPTNQVKYLGVIFDKQLRFKEHMQYVTGKGTRAAMALSRIAKNHWGPQYQHIRQLFNAVIAARTDYAASI